MLYILLCCPAVSYYEMVAGAMNQPPVPQPPFRDTKWLGNILDVFRMAGLLSSCDYPISYAHHYIGGVVVYFDLRATWRLRFVTPTSSTLSQQPAPYILRIPAQTFRNSIDIKWRLYLPICVLAD
jgi:hypothetical protein